MMKVKTVKNDKDGSLLKETLQHIDSKGYKLCKKIKGGGAFPGLGSPSIMCRGNLKERSDHH